MKVIQTKKGLRQIRKEPLYIGIFMLALAILGLIYAGWDGYVSYMARPEPGLKGKDVLVSIDRGMAFKQVTRRLHEKDVISNKMMFNVAGRLKGVTKKIQAGDYTFRDGMPPMTVLDMITRGDITTVRLLVPEGFTVFDVARRLERLGPWTADAFMEASADKADQMGLPADTVEGYLFPAAYDLKMSMNETRVIELMIKYHERVKTDERLSAARKEGLSWHEALTLASVVQKESANVGEMPTVSSVFHNRLDRGMFLQSDPTAIYGVKDQRDGVTAKDLEHPGEYNTYVHKGLPPGPICNPGADAIDAALYPRDTDYLYFVADGEGGHSFSTSYAGHRRNVNTYRQKLREAEKAAEQNGGGG